MRLIPYLGLRQLALNMKPEQWGLKLDNNGQVYAAVVDCFQTEQHTLVCYFDDTMRLVL
mgnify:CR=1 FL=1